MKNHRRFNILAIVAIVLSGATGLAACPSADLTGDCFVDSEDLVLTAKQWLARYNFEGFALMSRQWLTTEPCGPNDPTVNLSKRGNDCYTSDCYDANPYDNPREPASDTYRILCGGSRTHKLAFPMVKAMPSLEESLDVELSLNKSWMYQNLPTATASGLTANLSITDDQYNNSYTYDWEIILPDDVTLPPAITDGGTDSDKFCKLAAPPCDDPNGISDAGLTFTLKVTVTGDDYGNTGIAETGFGVALLGDINNDASVNDTDREIINTFWRLGSADLFTFTDCDVNCDSAVNVADRSITNAVWRGVLGQNSVTNPCPFRPQGMVFIPSGEFEMGDHHGDGCSDELPVHFVYVDSFYMSRYEITNRQFCDYLNSAYPARINVNGGIVYAASDSRNSCPYCSTHSYSTYSQIDYSAGLFSVRSKGGRDMSDDPVVQVSWYGAAGYCNWRSRMEGYQPCYNLSAWECDFTKNGYRLPTEAEWEYAARGGRHDPYCRFPWGDTISHNWANYYSYWFGGTPYFPYDLNQTSCYHPHWNDGINPFTSVVGSFRPNGYGLYDMAGNIWEWCNDWYDESYYDISLFDNPQGPTGGTDRLLRGGGWYRHPNLCRVAYRNGNDPDSCYYDIGFRIVLAH